MSWEYGVPACWHFDWPLPNLPAPVAVVDTTDRLAVIQAECDALLAAIRSPEDELRERLQLWQYGRCAVCCRQTHLVEDHDHESGLTRGYLCGSCNVGEGVNRSPLFSLYRWRHPTSLLGLEIRYIDPITGTPDMGTGTRRVRDNAMRGAL